MLAFLLAILCREPEHLWDGACGHGLSLSQNFAALLTPSSVMVLTPLRVGWVATDDSSTAVHTVSCSWHFNVLKVSMLATTQCKKRSFFLSKLRATQNFGGKHKYLEGSVKAQPASKAKQLPVSHRLYKEVPIVWAWMDFKPSLPFLETVSNK